ncbi:MAG: hypothetical protein Tsb0033_09980 [Winogradskyella sp.]
MCIKLDKLLADFFFNKLFKRSASTKKQLSVVLVVGNLLSKSKDLAGDNTSFIKSPFSFPFGEKFNTQKYNLKETVKNGTKNLF